MNEQEKLEFEELLNAVVDDEITDRQQTELKRLSGHDPEIERQLSSLRRQKQLLNALPIESAPENLVANVTSVLKPRFISGNSAESDKTVTGTSHLLLRRILTTAAMLLLPLGLLSFVVYEIIKPASVGPVDYVTPGEILVQADESTPVNRSEVLAREFPFDGVLTFRTNQHIQVGNFAEKMIFDLGLYSSTVPSRTVDVTTYQITASPEMIAKLIDALNEVWPRCLQVTLNVLDSAQENTIDIFEVEPEQVKALAAEDSREMLDVLAKQYAAANQNSETVLASTREKDTDSASTPTDYPPLTVPILTGRHGSPPSVEPAQSTVRLRIHIKRSVQ